MDLRKLSEKIFRWTGVRCNSSADDEAAGLIDLCQFQLRIAVDLGDEAGFVATEHDDFVPFQNSLEFDALGRDIFDELSKLTDSPALVGKLRSAMLAFGRTASPTFELRGGPVRFAVIPGGGARLDRPSARYIDDSADDAPKAG